MKYWFLCSCIFFNILSSLGQILPPPVDSNKAVILIVPYNRFEFHTEFTLSVLAEFNKVETNEVYDLFRGSFLNAITQSNCEKYRFKIINATNLNYLARRVTYVYSDTKPSYYKANIDRLKELELQQIMRNYNADYILFINWYHIEKLKIKNFRVDNYDNTYSKHFIDFDIYNAKKESILWRKHFEIEQAVNISNVIEQGLVIKALINSYKEMAIKICDDMPVTP